VAFGNPRTPCLSQHLPFLNWILLQRLFPNGSFSKTSQNFHFAGSVTVFQGFGEFYEDILASFFNTQYLWTVAFLFPLSLNFVDFFVRFSLPI
jgi:hypothetical protein